MNKFYKINENDNVAVVLEDIISGYEENGVAALSNIPFGHKILLKDLKANENIIKYGYPIGHLTYDCKAGEHIHSHNLKTNLKENNEFKYKGQNNQYKLKKSNITFNGYKRKNGSVATRNEIWIISTVGCINKTTTKLEKIANDIIDEKYCDGAFAITHPFGCSQLGDDQENTRKILASLINHPNAGGVLVVSLGYENTNIEVLKNYLGDIDDNRVKFLICQDEEDELQKGTELLKELYNNVKNNKREPISISELTIGFKCGGSDAFSGITANALCGTVNDKLTSFGAKTILTEVPEMFGAEDILMNRAENKEVFEKMSDMINGFKNYFVSHNQVVYENPSPGNKAGGITTLEEKSLGCVQKGGKAIVTDVLKYSDTCKKSGLNLLTGPGNDIVSLTNLTASGANVILFTTGRGTPLGAYAPTLKLSSNTNIYNKKGNWIDFNCGELINGREIDNMANELLNLIIDTASGKKTKSEINDYREISILKDGVVL